MNRRLEIIKGDCVEAMAAMEAESVDAIVTDPPYGIGFMGREWDNFVPGTVPDRWTKADGTSGYGPGTRQGSAMGTGKYDLSLRANHIFQEWTRLWAVEALRVLKPGGWAAVFGGTRTYHRMICGLEDAGFEIRDCLMWLYGSGFPKSLDIGKAIDKAAGGEREPDAYTGANYKNKVYGSGMGGGETLARGAPATDAAKEHEGKGTALKPAWEPICLARKPLEGTVAENVLKYGTGGLNIGACRIGTDDVRNFYKSPDSAAFGKHGIYGTSEGRQVTGSPNGRWPANLILDEESGELLDDQSGESVSRIGIPRSGRNGEGWGMTATGAEHDDTGGASRFFYCAKTSAWERNAGLEGMRIRTTEEISGGGGIRPEKADAYQARKSPRRNHHPTVKPVSLMRWLVKLITPGAGGQAFLPAGEKGSQTGMSAPPTMIRGVVLDPFAGSGTTGMACSLEGFDFIGFEKETEYAEIARRRIEYARVNPRAFDEGMTHARPEKVDAGQGELF